MNIRQSGKILDCLFYRNFSKICIESTVNTINFVMRTISGLVENRKNISSKLIFVPVRITK